MIRDLTFQNRNKLEIPFYDKDSNSEGMVEVCRENFNSIGLQLTKHNGEDILNIYPITSKNNIGRCLIEIPIEEIDNLIEILKKFK
jgi:NADH/NAD ratio-sensing transcriptional regulator Rex